MNTNSLSMILAQQEVTSLPSGDLRHHGAGQCAGEKCPLHKPSNHEYRDYPMDWNSDWGLMVRLVDDEQIVDPDDMNNRPGYIKRNSARCLKCGTEVVSRHRHDYVTCPCGNVSCDGGNAYLRRSFKTDGWVDTSDVI